jgi:hypothetical protein
MSGIYGEDRLLQLLPCVAGRHDHERHLREGEGDGVAVRWEDGQAVGPHTGLLHLRGWRQRLLQRRRARARQQRHLLLCGWRRMEAAMVRTEVDGGGDLDRGTDGGGDPNGGRWRQRRCGRRRMEAVTQTEAATRTEAVTQIEARMVTEAVTQTEARTEEATAMEVATRTEVVTWTETPQWKVGAETQCQLTGPDRAAEPPVPRLTAASYSSPPPTARLLPW